MAKLATLRLRHRMLDAMTIALTAIVIVAFLVVAFLLTAAPAWSQPTKNSAASAAPIPADPRPRHTPLSNAPGLIPAAPWPRDISISNGGVLIYQPQVNRWEGNQIDLRAALAIKPTGAKEETFGVVFATARTQVAKVARRGGVG